MGQQAVRAELDDEVRAVFAVDGRFCVAGELSVMVYDAERGVVEDRFEADDVLDASWWEDGTLFVEDVAGRRYAFQPSAHRVPPAPTFRVR